MEFKMFQTDSKSIDIDKFYSVKKQLSQKIPKTNPTLSTYNTVIFNKKVNLLLIPDFSEFLSQYCTNHNKALPQNYKSDDKQAIKGNAQSKLGKNENQNFLYQSYIHKYFWEQIQNIDIKQHSRKYNLIYNNLPSHLDINSQMLHSQNHLLTRHAESAHFFSINLKQKQNIKFNSLNEKLNFHKGNRKQNLFNQNSLLFKDDTNSKINRDTNIDVWHTNGLEFGSNILKFGTRNKHIALVIYHNNSNNLPNQTNLEVQKAFRKKQQKWSNFIREGNKKCIIGHLYIIEDSVQDQKLENNPNGMNQDIIKLTQIPQRDNQYRVNIQIRRNNGNNHRIILIVDKILEEHVGNSIFRNSQRSYSNIQKLIKKQTSSKAIVKKQLNHEQFCIHNDNISQHKSVFLDSSDIRKKHQNQIKNKLECLPNNFSYVTPIKNRVISQKTTAQKKLSRPKSPYFLQIQSNKSIRLSKTKNSKGLVVLSKSIPKYRKQFDLFELLKTFSCSSESPQNISQPNCLLYEHQNPNFYAEQNKKTRSNPIRRNIFKKES